MNSEYKKDMEHINDRSAAVAVRWISKIKSGDMTPAEQVQLKDWLAQDPGHQVEFDLVNDIWNCADVLENDPLVMRETAVQYKRRYRGWLKRWTGGFKLRHSFIAPLALTAATVLLVMGFWWTARQNHGPTLYSTPIGQQLTVALVDGSTAYLDTDTTITTRFNETAREIELISGKALFYVVHEKERPFLVKAGKITVRAVGTEFNVYKDNSDRVSVAVTQGSVQITGPATWQDFRDQSGSPEPDSSAFPEKVPSDLPPDVIVAGKEVVIDEKKGDYEIKDIALVDNNSWRWGKLLFNNVPLSQAVDEMNRYLTEKIVIVDDRIKDMPVSMTFSVRDRKYFVKTLEKALTLESRKAPDGRTLLMKTGNIATY